MDNDKYFSLGTETWKSWMIQFSVKKTKINFFKNMQEISDVVPSTSFYGI